MVLSRSMDFVVFCHYGFRYYYLPLLAHEINVTNNNKCLFCSQFLFCGYQTSEELLPSLQLVHPCLILLILFFLLLIFYWIWCLFSRKLRWHDEENVNKFDVCSLALNPRKKIKFICGRHLWSFIIFSGFY